MSSFTHSLILEDTGDGRFWKVFRGFEYHVGLKGSGTYVSVHAGMLTDLASIPRLLQSLVPVSGRGNAAAVVHDKLYRKPLLRHAWTSERTEISRKQADWIFFEALRVQGASWSRANVMYTGVRLGGWAAWNRYRREQRLGA